MKVRIYGDFIIASETSDDDFGDMSVQATLIKKIQEIIIGIYLSHFIVIIWQFL